MTDDPTHDLPDPDDTGRAHTGPDPHAPAGDDVDDTIGGLLDDLDPDDGADLDPYDDLDADDDTDDEDTDDDDSPGHGPDPHARDAEGIDLDLDTSDDDGDDTGTPGSDPDTISLDVADEDVFGADGATLVNIAALGGVDADALQAALSELGLDDAPDARSAVVALEHLGVDAVVAFGDVDQLVELLEGGTTIQVGDARLIGVDDLTDEALVETADGRTGRVALDELERRWADQGYELVVGADGRAVLPISLDRRDGGVPG